MSKVTNVMIGLLEEQAALLLRHIAVLKNLPHDASEGSAAVVVEGPKKKVKAPVDPNKPKRPLSGYQIFMAEHNGECKEKNPDANATAIMTMVAGAWSVLTPDQKETYLVRAEKLKEQYLVEMQKYIANKFKDGSDASDVEVPAPKVKASKSAASSSSAAEPKKAVAAAPVPTPVPVAAPAATPKKDEEKSKKHKRSDSDDSEAVIFTAPETHDTDKKKKVSCCFFALVFVVVICNVLLLLLFFAETQKGQEISVWGKRFDMIPYGYGTC